MTVGSARRIDVGRDIRAAPLILFSISNARAPPEHHCEDQESTECDGQQQKIIRGHYLFPDVIEVHKGELP
ncbi:MAG: hypothetical protein K2X72_21085 [Reyranella sp.]|nr:hypothetical protein [Reyranella sp.]